MMKTTLGQLRKLLQEFGLDADMRNMAGTCGGEGANNGSRDREAVMNPPPGLGSPEDEEQDELDVEDDVQRKNQAGARVYDRAGGTNVGQRKP